MRQRFHKYLFSLLFAVFVGGTFFLTSCSDNPDAKAAKAVRQETAAAIDTLGRDKKYDDAQQKIEAAMERNRAQGLTRDAALLASGNLRLAQGLQQQSQLGLLAMPVRNAADQLEKMIRQSEDYIIEKERIQMLLASGVKEKDDLKNLLEQGMAESPALTGLREAVQSEMDKLNTEKASIEQQRQQTQGTLDEHQQKADELLRQAEMAAGQEKLNLQQQAYDILKQRKDFYIEAQAAENQLAVINSQMQILQSRLDNLNQSIDQITAKIDAIENSEARQMLAAQMEEMNSTQTALGTKMIEQADLVSQGMKNYKTQVDALLALYDEALSELDNIQSGAAGFAAVIRRAEVSHQAALACSSMLRFQSELNERLVDLLQTTDPNLAATVQDRLPIAPLEDAFKQKAMDLFAKAFENYEEAYGMSEGMEKDAQCSIIKSHVLAVSHKMRLADALGDFDLANQTETAMNELMKKGTELGTCFTQSEAVKVIQNDGLNYTPDLPLNLDVLAEGLKQQFSEWKRLPIAEQEAAVNSDLEEIDKYIAQYGQDLATHLEPLKQEMISAKERGFKEVVTPPAATGGEPNAF